MDINVGDIEKAAKRLRGVIHSIPAGVSSAFSEMSGAELYLKYENRQKTGSFKARGAYNKLAVLVERGQKPESVVASSAGNHAQGVAYAAGLLGIRSTIVMPVTAPIAKISATEGYGAQTVLYGEAFDDAYQKAREIEAETGAVFIHAFDDSDIIAGQGTVGLEILGDLPAVDTVIVPTGGGGLLAGVALCIKSINPRVRVIGVQAEGADAVARGFKEKTHVHSEKVRTIADGIAVGTPGKITMEIINKYADDVITVSDDEISSAILLLLERTKQVVEPAGAAGAAAVISGRLDIKGKKAVCVLSGGNIDVSFIQRIVERGLVSRGRRIRLKALINDVPGSLEAFAYVVAEAGANILSVRHDRIRPELSLYEAFLYAECEVSGPAHGKELLEALKVRGFRVELE